MHSGSLWLEEKYLNLLSPRLERFTRRGKAHNFRCPLCGDSQKNRFKARAYVFEVGGKLMFKCHNCGRGLAFTSLLKSMDDGLFGEYRVELLKEMGTTRPRVRPKAQPIEEKVIDADVLSGLKRMDHFSDDHPVKSYLKGRMIPQNTVDSLYYADRFMEWVNTIVPDKFSKDQLRMDEPRLVIPFIAADGSVFAVTGRSFKKKSIKYITIKLDEGREKIYGMDRIDPSRRVYVFEGPIDSFFIDNSVAFAGSSGAVPKFKDSVIVLDNEPRNREIVKLMEKFVEQGHRVCVWPAGTEGKDVNDMIVAGRTPDEIRRTIDSNAFHGLMAKAKIADYRRR